jgi:hypothetical protein
MNGNRKSGETLEINVIILGRSVCALGCVPGRTRCCDFLHHQVFTDTATVTLIYYRDFFAKKRRRLEAF